VEEGFEKQVFRKAGWVSPVMLVHGAIAGVWKHEFAGRRLEVAVMPFAHLSTKTRKLVKQEQDRLGSFLGAPPRLSFGPQTTGSSEARAPLYRVPTRYIKARSAPLSSRLTHSNRDFRGGG
jgi:hypothetical protein